MRPLQQVLVRLYPRSWRRRYGREFEALLEDVEPGPRELFDICKGALAMRVKTAGVIPVVCALIGAFVGGIVVLQTPELFASSAMIRLNSDDEVNGPMIAELLRVSLDGVPANVRAATSVRMPPGNTRAANVVLSYQDTNPAEAQRVARMLTERIATRTRLGVEVLGAATLPDAPVRRDYTTPVASGSGLGLLAGSVVLLFFRSRKRPASAV